MPQPAQRTPDRPLLDAGGAGVEQGPWPQPGAAASLWGPIALAATIFLFHLGSYGLWEPDEARYAEIARELLATRDFVVPHLNYVPYVEKPPLLYWLTALSFAIGGANEFAARLVPALSALFGVIATCLFARRVFDWRRGALAGAILATAPLYAVMAQVLTTDMLLTSFVTLAMFAFFLAWNEGGRWRWLFYAAMGLGTLAKGPVAIVIPMLAAVAFLGWQRQLRGALMRFSAVLGMMLTAAIAAPWFVAVSVREPDFVSFYFFGEHIRRFFESSFSHGEPLYFYVPVVILGFLPWSIVVPLAGSAATANRAARDFCLISATVILVFFSLASGKLIPYILPALPPLAVAVADVVLGIESPRDGGDSDALAASRRRFDIATPLVVGLIGIVMVAAAMTAPTLKTPYALLAGPYLLVGGLIAIAGAALVGVSLARRRSEVAPVIVVLTMAAAIVAGSYARLATEPLRSYANLSRMVAMRAPSATLICYHRYVQALAFYCKRRVILVGPPSELRFGMGHSADASQWFLSTDDDLIKLWNAPGGKVLLIDEPDLQRLRPRLGEFTVIASEARKRAISHSNGPAADN